MFHECQSSSKLLLMKACTDSVILIYIYIYIYIYRCIYINMCIYD